MSHATCSNCFGTLGPHGILEACPNCGSVNRTLSSFNVAGIEIFPCVRHKVRNPSYQGRHKHIRETKSVAEHSADGRLVRVEQTIDRGRNRYRKKVAVVDTGEVLRDANHPLSEHTGHGSNKLGRKQK